MPVEIEVDVILFDMDGTLIDSTPAVNATWVEFAHEFDLDLDDVLHNAHGKRTVENITHYIPSLTEEQVQSAVVRFETRVLEIAEENLRTSKETGVASGTIVPMPGAKQLLSELDAGSAANPHRRQGWAIVTSSTRAYAKRAFSMAEVGPIPHVFITSDDCTHGKPDPEPYLKGAERSNAAIATCIVVEDAPPGVLSGKRGGARVLGLETTHDGKRMWECGATWLAQDLSKVHARWDGDHLFVLLDAAPAPQYCGKRM
ncbi:hypothetical protein MVES1_003913 [Malassezia vespertilionis]|uniref:uncharacterized protein n=1 Tax=Malassezia vespertilionis TaxID=2020962 RepID=UPI0024B19E8A|nr:uncharacterized protein MVES1_003913 [Malassezia vespertilionis]WFD08537.1 hypothetical protein MVES1_003913 [Malassezia vespertilionis]